MEIWTKEEGYKIKRECWKFWKAQKEEKSPIQ